MMTITDSQGPRDVRIRRNKGGYHLETRIQSTCKFPWHEHGLFATKAQAYARIAKWSMIQAHLQGMTQARPRSVSGLSPSRTARPRERR